MGRVELHHLPVPGASLAGEGGDEGVDGGGVVQVPQQLAGAPAGDGSPVPVFAGIQGRGAPAPSGRSYRCAVAASDDGQAAVGQDQAAFRGGRAGGHPKILQGGDELGEPRAGDPEQPLQVPGSDPGPVGEQVDDALLGWLEQGGQEVVRKVPPRRGRVEACGERRAGRGRSRGSAPSAVIRVEDRAQAEGGTGGRQPPDRVIGACAHRILLQGEVNGRGKARQQAAGVAQADLVGHEEQDAGRAAVPRATARAAC